jgi:hypothetical protein
VSAELSQVQSSWFLTRVMTTHNFSSEGHKSETTVLGTVDDDVVVQRADEGSLPGDGTCRDDSRQLSVLTPTRLREHNNYRKPPPNQLLGHPAYSLSSTCDVRMLSLGVYCALFACISHAFGKHLVPSRATFVDYIYHLPDS